MFFKDLELLPIDFFLLVSILWIWKESATTIYRYKNIAIALNGGKVAVYNQYLYLQNIIQFYNPVK